MNAEHNQTRVQLVLVPGLLSDEYVWREMIAALDLYSDLALEVFLADISQHSSLVDMARSVLARVPGDASAPILVAGHSMGARVVLEMVRLSPERIKGVALLDTGVHPRAASEAEKRQALVDLAAEKGMGALADRWLPPMVDPARLADHAFIAGLRSMVLRADVNQFKRQVNALLGRPDGREMLAKITCPTLLVVGENDLWSPPHQHEQMLEALPNARLEIIKSSGHFSPTERPNEVAQVLGAWITDCQTEQSSA